MDRKVLGLNAALNKGDKESQSKDCLLKQYFVGQKWPSSRSSTGLSDQLGAAWRDCNLGKKATGDPELTAGGVG